MTRFLAFLVLASIPGFALADAPPIRDTDSPSYIMTVGTAQTKAYAILKANYLANQDYPLTFQNRLDQTLQSDVEMEQYYEQQYKKTPQDFISAAKMLPFLSSYKKLLSFIQARQAEISQGQTAKFCAAAPGIKTVVSDMRTSFAKALRGVKLDTDANPLFLLDGMVSGIVVGDASSKGATGMIERNFEILQTGLCGKSNPEENSFLNLYAGENSAFLIAHAQASNDCTELVRHLSLGVTVEKQYDNYSGLRAIVETAYYFASELSASHYLSSADYQQIDSMLTGLKMNAGSFLVLDNDLSVENEGVNPWQGIAQAVPKNVSPADLGINVAADGMLDGLDSDADPGAGFFQIRLLPVSQIPPGNYCQ